MSIKDERSFKKPFTNSHFFKYSIHFKFPFINRLLFTSIILQTPASPGWFNPARHVTCQSLKTNNGGVAHLATTFVPNSTKQQSLLLFKLLTKTKLNYLKIYILALFLATFVKWLQCTHFPSKWHNNTCIVSDSRRSAVHRQQSAAQEPADRWKPHPHPNFQQQMNLPLVTFQKHWQWSCVWRDERQGRPTRIRLMSLSIQKALFLMGFTYTSSNPHFRFVFIPFWQFINSDCSALFITLC